MQPNKTGQEYLLRSIKRKLLISILEKKVKPLQAVTIA